MKLLIIASEGVDVVLLPVPDDYTRATGEERAIEIAEEYADMKGEVRIDEVIDIGRVQLDEWRPFIG